MMYELTNRKTGNVYGPITEEEYESIKEKGLLSRFIVNKVEPIRKLTPIPRMVVTEVEVKNIKSKIDDKRGTKNLK